MIRSAVFSTLALLITSEYALAFQAHHSYSRRSRHVYSSTVQDFDASYALVVTAPIIMEPIEDIAITEDETIVPQSSVMVDASMVTNNILDVWTGRMLVMAAAAMYGTNFPLVKMLDESLPSAVSASLRFVLAAVLVSTVVLTNEDKAADTIIEKERFDSTIRGMEVGAWYCAGFICQALALQSVEAGKVRLDVLG